MFKKYWQTDDGQKVEAVVRRVRKIKDEQKLARIVREAFRSEVEMAAQEQIHSEQILVELLLSGKIHNTSAEQTIAQRITNKQAIYAYVFSGRPYNKVQVAEFLTDEYRYYLVNCRRGTVPMELRDMALNKIKEQDKLLPLAYMQIVPSISAPPAPYPHKDDDDRKLIRHAVQALARINRDSQKDMYVQVLTHHTDEELIKQIIFDIGSREILEEVAEKAGPTARKLAAEKLEKRKELDEIVADPKAKPRDRWNACQRLRLEFSDPDVVSKLYEDLNLTFRNGHVLYRTIYSEWEQVEYVCLRCGKVGGQTDDSESTHHYGCNFSSERCRGY
ncbi:MAG: hypothetical protein J5589_03775 [Firmicutes bacterium]|nr:hypothetical protein [Bacillota bacterium]